MVPYDTNDDEPHCPSNMNEKNSKTMKYKNKVKLTSKNCQFTFKCNGCKKT